MQASSISKTDWFLLVSLGMIWGSSFVLMKIGARALSGYEIAALRMSVAGGILLPFFIQIARKIDFKLWKWIALISLCGSGLPSIFFAIAAPHIDSNISGVINSLTPIFTFIVSVFLFKNKIQKKGKIGVVIGFFGVLILFIQKKINWGNTSYALLPLLAAIFYGININLVKEKLSHLKPFEILVSVFGILSVVGGLYLAFFTNVFSIDVEMGSLRFWEATQDMSLQKSRSIIAICVLGLIGSTLSSLLFYYLLRSTNAVFASMNTYLIPIMAIFWGFLDGESISWIHFLSLGIILVGVYLVSERRLKFWKSQNR